MKSDAAEVYSIFTIPPFHRVYMNFNPYHIQTASNFPQAALSAADIKGIDHVAHEANAALLLFSHTLNRSQCKPPLRTKSRCICARRHGRINCLRIRRTRNIRHGEAVRRVAGIGVCRTILHTLPAPWQPALLTPFACTNLRWGIGTLPQQTGVYVPRCLNQANGPMTGASSHGAKSRQPCALCADLRR